MDDKSYVQGLYVEHEKDIQKCVEDILLLVSYDVEAENATITLGNLQRAVNLISQVYRRDRERRRRMYEYIDSAFEEIYG